jgi:hypothetical protein
MKLFFILLFVSQNIYAWTLNNNFTGSFENNRVNVFVDEGTVCSTNLMTPDELESLVAPAVDQFWNKVPTSNLRLKAAGFSEHIDTINEGRLCSPTNETCIEEGTTAGNADPLKGLIPAVDDIIIACNDNPLNFGGSNVLAVTIPNKYSGKKIVGALILINDSSNVFGELSRNDQIGVIAHEIGHAIGLGHSKENASLMYYRTVEQRKRLGQDDIDGVSFLYPMKGDLYGLSENGLLASCGTISHSNYPPKGPPPLVQMGLTLILMILLFKIKSLLNRSKARAPL